jgi:hypothetical protein
VESATTIATTMPIAAVPSKLNEKFMNQLKILSSALQQLTPQQLSFALFIGVSSVALTVVKKAPYLLSKPVVAKSSKTEKPTKSTGSPSSSLKDGVSRGRLLEGRSIPKIYLHDIATLRNSFPSTNCKNDLTDSYNKVLGDEDFIINEIVHSSSSSGETDAWVRAGPREFTHFDPTKVRAAIVTCGGLCPGLNNVIRDLVRALKFLYHAEIVYGIRYVVAYVLMSITIKYYVLALL